MKFKKNDSNRMIRLEMNLFQEGESISLVNQKNRKADIVDEEYDAVYKLIKEGGMSIDEALTFYFSTDMCLEFFSKIIAEKFPMVMEVEETRPGAALAITKEFLSDDQVRQQFFSGIVEKLRSDPTLTKEVKVIGEKVAENISNMI